MRKQALIAMVVVIGYLVIVWIVGGLFWFFRRSARSSGRPSSRPSRPSSRPSSPWDSTFDIPVAELGPVTELEPVAELEPTSLCIIHGILLYNMVIFLAK